MLTIVPDATACVVERLGRYHRTLLAGMHFLVPVIDRVAHRFSLRPQDRDLSDRCITFDNVPVSISSRVRWQILDPERAAYGAADVVNFLSTLVTTAQRNWISARKWSDVRESTRELEAGVVDALAGQTDAVGVRVVDLSVVSLERV